MGQLLTWGESVIKELMWIVGLRLFSIRKRSNINVEIYDFGLNNFVSVEMYVLSLLKLEETYEMTRRCYFEQQDSFVYETQAEQISVNCL